MVLGAKLFDRGYELGFVGVSFTYESQTIF